MLIKYDLCKIYIRIINKFSSTSIYIMYWQSGIQIFDNAHGELEGLLKSLRDKWDEYSPVI